MSFWASLLAVLALASVHVFGHHLKFLDVVPRSRWLSFAGGVAVSYAIVHLLPELEEHQESLRTAAQRAGIALQDHIYLMALGGVVAFYALERLVRSRRNEQRSAEKSPPSDSVFWIHIGSFAAYNALVAYLLLYEERSNFSLAIFTIALSLHFLVNDHGLWTEHRRTYVGKGRWALAGALFLGLTVGYTTKLPPVATSALLGFLVGGIILNTFKEELPEDRESRVWPFVTGAAVYATLLLVM